MCVLERIWLTIVSGLVVNDRVARCSHGRSDLMPNSLFIGYDTD